MFLRKWLSIHAFHLAINQHLFGVELPPPPPLPPNHWPSSRYLASSMSPFSDRFSPVFLLLTSVIAADGSSDSSGPDGSRGFVAEP